MPTTNRYVTNYIVTPLPLVPREQNGLLYSVSAPIIDSFELVNMVGIYFTYSEDKWYPPAEVTLGYALGKLCSESYQHLKLS